jgi:hypothetical protein
MALVSTERVRLWLHTLNTRSALDTRASLAAVRRKSAASPESSLAVRGVRRGGNRNPPRPDTELRQASASAITDPDPVTDGRMAK